MTTSVYDSTWADTTVSSSSSSFDFELSVPAWPFPCTIGTVFVLGLLYGRPFLETTLSTTSTDSIPEEARTFLVHPEQLYERIREAREKIAAHKEHWRFKLSTTVSTSGLKLIPHTSAGTYLLCDQNEEPFFVVKPGDEDIFCLNDPHHSVPPADGVRVRTHIPLYQGPQREVAAYQIARLAETFIVPRTMMAIISSPKFYDLTDPFNEPKWQSWAYGIKAEDRVQEFFDSSGHPDKEKVSSVRAYIPGKTLYALEHRLSLEGRDDELEELIDPDDIEAANVIMWLTGNTDGHPGNIIAYLKGKGPDGREIYGLKLIDFALSFPEKNGGLHNILPDMVGGGRKLSEGAKAVIADLSVEQMVEQLKFYELDGAIDAFLERVAALKALASMDLTLEEINTRMRHLSHGLDAAINPSETTESLPSYYTTSSSVVTTAITA